MGSRRDASALEHCVTQIKTKKRKVCDTSYEKNYIAVSQAIDDVLQDRQHVKDIKTKLKDIKKTRGHTKDYELAESDYNLVEDLTWQKKRCLETVLYITEIENLFQSVQNEFEERSLYLTERKPVFESVYRDEEVESSSRMHRDCAYDIKKGWMWISDLTQCLNTHVKNAAEFNQYHHDVRHLDEDMETYLLWLNSETIRKPVITKDPEVMINHFRFMTTRLLDYQGRVDRLRETAQKIYPIYFRKELPSYSVKARSLVDYKHQEMSLERNETCTVLDISDTEKWKVKTESGKEGDVPAIVLTIPPPDPRSFLQAEKLREQLVVHWDTSLKRLRLQLMQFMTIISKETQSREFQGLSANQKAEFLKLTNDSIQVLRVKGEDVDYNMFKSQMTSIRKILTQVKPGTKILKNVNVQKWQGTGHVFQQYTDLLAYIKSYKGDLARKIEEENFVVRDLQTQSTFTSKAYFESALPMVDIDTSSKETKITRVRSSLYIHERHKPKKPVAPPRRKRQVKQGVKTDDLFSETTEYSEESKTFVIVGVIDPRNKEKLSVFQALSNGVLDQANGTYNNPDTDYSITIPEAINKGYILIEFRDPMMNGVSEDSFSLQNQMDYRIFGISGVIDPRTGELISVKEAIATGLIDLRRGIFRNPITGEEMSLLDAIKAGYLIADPSYFTDPDEKGTFTSVEMMDLKYVITSVTDPNSGEELSLKRAIQDGIIDQINGLYRNPLTGESMTIAEAFKLGLIKGRLFDPSKDKEDENTLSIQQLQIRKQRFVPSGVDVSISNGRDSVDGMLKHKDPNEVLFSKIKEQVDPKEKCIKDPLTKEEISIEDAFERGIINFAKAEFDTLDGEILPIEEATARGLIEPSVLQKILKTYQEASVGQLIDSGKFDPETGLVVDTATGHTLSLQAAVSQNIIDPDTTFFYDVPSQRIMSLSTAIESGRCNLVSGKIVKSATGEELSVSEAINTSQILAHINPQSVAEHAETLSVLRKVMDTKIKGIKIPSSKEILNIEEAVSAGVLNIPLVAYADETQTEINTLQTAIKNEKIEPECGMALFMAFQRLSLQDAIQSKTLDSKKGKYIDPKTGEAIAIDKAQEKGLWNPNYVYFVDNEARGVTSLGAFMNRGKFDPSSGKVISDKTGKSMTIEQAIADGLINPVVDAVKFVDITTTLKDLIDSGKVNPRSTTFVAPNDMKMSLRDGLANGLLTMSSKVKLDPETGNVILMSEEDVVKSLVDVKENSDWLTEVEKLLGCQGRPSERLGKLKEQTKGTKMIQKNLKEKEPALRSAVKQSEDLVENNQDKKQTDGGQQYKKLKYNTSDLKVRLDSASSEVINRVEKMDSMCDNLEEFYGQMEKLDHWLDTAIETTQDLQSSNTNIEDQFHAFKDFYEEVKSKEEDIQHTSKLADNFTDHAQCFERELETYRKSLPFMPTIDEETEAGILDDEIESMEAKYKDVSRECSKHMDRLSSIVKNKRTFDDVNDRLTSQYPQLTDQLKSINDKGFGKNPAKDSKDLKDLKQLKADVIGQERKLKDLMAAGERLTNGLVEAGLKKEAANIRNVIEDHKNKHTDLLNGITSKEEKLDAAVAQQQNVMGRLDSILDVVENAEKILKSKHPASLNKEVLSNQIQEQRLLNADINSNKALVDRLSRESHDMTGAEDKLTDIGERLDVLERLAEDRTQELEDISSGINDFDHKLSEVDSWLNESIQTLKTKPKGGNNISKAKIDALYEEKKGKEGSIDNLRKACDNLMNDDRVCDHYAVKETLGDVETKWNDLTEFLVQQVSLESLSKIDGMLKYLDKAENEINTAEPISVDPETLEVQLRDHTAFNDDLIQKKNAVKDIINKCNKMLRETTNSQTDEIKSRLDSIQTQADIVCQLSSERLHQLESALPLAGHYSDTQAEVTAWLDEMEAELKAQGKPGESLEQIRKQYDHLKGTQQIIQDHKPFIDDLNSTGLELMDLCGDEDGNDIQTKLIDSNQKYEALKNQARHKARQLTDAKKKFTQEVSDSLDHLVEELAQLNAAVINSDPIPAAPEKLRNEIDEMKAVLEDLERQKPDIEKAREISNNLQAHGIEDPVEAEDVQSKVVEINKLYGQVQYGAKGKEQQLGSALAYSDKLFDISSDVMASLRDLKDNMYSQEPAGVDPPTVKEQQSELEGLMNELDKARELMLDCRRIGDDLCDICGEPGKIEVKKQIEDLVNLADDVADLVKDRREELKKALEHAEKYEDLLESINSWLPLSEHKLAGMRPPSSDPDALKDQMDEVKLFKSNVHPHITDMQQLNQQVAALKDMSPVASEVLMKPVEIVNDKWNDLIHGIADREGLLNDMQVQVGKLEHAMDDVVGALNQVQKDLDKFENLNGDPKCLETQIRKLQLQQGDINNQDRTGRKINKAVENLLANSNEDDSALKKKRNQMNEKIRVVQANARDKENKLQENLRQVKRYLGDVDDVLQWVNEFRMELKLNQPFGALPDTSDTQYEQFLKKCEEMDGREKQVQSLLQTGQEIIDTSKPDDTAQISDKMKKLRDRWNETRERARKRKEKMEEHAKNVTEFHDTLKAFTDWLNNAEVMMRGMKYPSKLVDVITGQIDSHDNLKSDLEAQAELMSTLDKSGTYLKYFGRKQDTIYIKNLLVGIRLRWKKLLRRADERGRLLQQAFKEDKRFYDAWKELCDWLDTSATKLSKFISGGKADKVMKQEMDELKKFEHQISVKHPTFYSTTRLGRNLKDRCTKNDPEREILQDMLDQLKNKWNSVRSVVSKSQNKLDEALLTSGRVSDALQSLIEWLHKAEATLEEDVPVLGDLDTVHMLNEQHKGIQQELLVREPTVETMRTAGNVPKSQKEELGNLWDRVNYLSDVRDNKLKDAMRLAEEFQDVVTVMREFLPQAESELKFRAFPEDEVAIIQLIERHEKFQEDLRNHQDTVDRIKTLAEDILQGCHPNAVRFVKYYLTITQTRWDQLIQRAKSRADRLQEALRNIQGNAALLEELLSWLTDAQSLLATKERDPLPEDLKVVETLLKEHLEFHDEVTTRNADAERLTKLVTLEAKMSPGKNFGSNMRLNEVDVYNPRVTALQNRWRIVWRMSVDRKKKLQDAYDTLLELESFKNFDFDVWRVRYRKWIQAKKFRISDFFRRQDKDCDGALSRDEFVSGMMQSKFPTNKTELNAVFDIFEKTVLRKPRMVYKEFIDALKADKRGRKSSVTTNKSDAELIHDEIERDVSGCQCRNQFKAVYLDEGKYRFGEKQRTYLVRFLNSTVMVRVGGGWITLEEFLETNDPCRARGRLNVDLRDTLLPDGTIDYRSSRRGSGTPLRSTSPFPTGASRKRQTDNGYASSNSSAGSSADTSLRRSRITSSMVNLSNANGLHKNPDFGSTGSLNRSKRLSTSSTSLHSNGTPRPKSKTPTPGSSPATNPTTRRPGSMFPRSTTPTPTSSPYTSRSRPTTPTAFSPRTTSTPSRPGSTTPTRGLTKTRQLPKTPRSTNR
ncbi:hypothetical protein SNE40_018056 [Patella caerulea]|uniref:Dystonin n=1 Tax=Patella caerulea TaxID=87958 RepID=A0AAN8JAS3_PATCE